MIRLPKGGPTKTPGVKRPHVKSPGSSTPFDVKLGNFSSRPTFVPTPAPNFRKSFGSFSNDFTVPPQFSTGKETSPEVKRTSDEEVYPDVYSEEGLELLSSLAGAPPEYVMEILRGKDVERPSGSKIILPPSVESPPISSNVSTGSEQQTPTLSDPAARERQAFILNMFSDAVQALSGAIFGGGGNFGAEQDIDDRSMQQVFEQREDEKANKVPFWKQSLTGNPPRKPRK